MTMTKLVYDVNMYYSWICVASFFLIQLVDHLITKVLCSYKNTHVTANRKNTCLNLILKMKDFIRNAVSLVCTIAFFISIGIAIYHGDIMLYLKAMITNPYFIFTMLSIFLAYRIMKLFYLSSLLHEAKKVRIG